MNRVVLPIGFGRIFPSFSKLRRNTLCGRKGTVDFYAPSVNFRESRKPAELSLEIPAAHTRYKLLAGASDSLAEGVLMDHVDLPHVRTCGLALELRLERRGTDSERSVHARNRWPPGTRRIWTRFSCPWRGEVSGHGIERKYGGGGRRVPRLRCQRFRRVRVECKRL